MESDSVVVEKIKIEDILSSLFREISKYYGAGDEIRFINAIDSLRIILCGMNGDLERPDSFNTAYKMWGELREIADKKGLLFRERKYYDTGTESIMDG